jgi:hypothetical protein
MFRATIILLLGFLFVSPPESFAQKAFKSSNWVFQTSANIGIYRYESVLKSTQERESNLAAARLYEFGIEKGIFDFLSVGLRTKGDNYFTEVNQYTNERPEVRSREWLIMANWHPIKTRYTDWVLGAATGVSNFKYAVNDRQASMATGTGFNYEFYLNPRFYIGNHFGLMLNIAYNASIYNRLNFENTATSVEDALSLKGGGMKIGAGLLFKWNNRY